MSKSIRIDDDLHEWLFANFPKEMSVSDVIRELKELWEQQQDKGK
jgi:predicted CopG family antitoxin